MVVVLAKIFTKPEHSDEVAGLFRDMVAWVQANEPGNYSMLRTSISPTIVQGGIRNNTIPSESEATLDIRLAPGEDGPAFLETLRKIINDPVYGFITIDDPLIFRIISHPWYQRLRRISQMALSYLVYPGAVHSRLHHSLGAYQDRKSVV